MDRIPTRGTYAPTSTDSDVDMDEALRRVRESGARGDLIWPAPAGPRPATSTIGAAA